MKKRFWKLDWLAELIISLDFLFATDSTSQRNLVSNAFLMRVGHFTILFLKYLSIFKGILISINSLISLCLLQFQH